MENFYKIFLRIIQKSLNINKLCSICENQKAGTEKRLEKQEKGACNLQEELL